MDIDDKIDKRVELLVGVLNELPETQTFGSCGGHKKNMYGLNRAPEGEFYIYFYFLLNKKIVRVIYR